MGFKNQQTSLGGHPPVSQGRGTRTAWICSRSGSSTTGSSSTSLGAKESPYLLLRFRGENKTCGPCIFWGQPTNLGKQMDLLEHEAVWVLEIGALLESNG